jgi:PAS domain S-box-containing protein
MLLGLAGCLVTSQIQPCGDVPQERWRMARTVLAGLLRGLAAWGVFLISLDGYFPFVALHIPSMPASISITLLIFGGIGSSAVTVYGGGGARNTVLAASMLSSSASCALFVSMSGIAQPLVLGYDLVAVLAVMICATALYSLGLRNLKGALTKWRRMLPATLIGTTLSALYLASFAAILPFSDWEAAAATPNALALQPITVVFFSEFLAALLLVRAGSSVDRQQAVRATRDNERLRQLTDSTFEGILVYRDGIILDANRAICLMIGVSLNEMKGRQLGDFAGLSPLATSQGAQPMELDLKAASGDMIPVETLSRDISFGEGIARVAAVRDIRERRAAQRSEQDQQRMADMQREAKELRERARLATEANRAKSTFLAMMSHEIRTPMNAVLGLASVLLDEGLSDGQQKMVSVIRESGEALLRILDDILDYSKLDAGRLSFEPMSFSPATLTHEAVSVHGPTAVAKGLSISAAVDPVMPEALLGDAGRIRQVLMNLVSNAVKFTDTGAVLIQARVISSNDETAAVMWEVRDTGIGIPKETLGNLFEEFVQADDSITRRFGGTGLGLAISRRIVQQMGGEIQVESQPGLGSVFRFSLTLARVTGPVVAEEAPADYAAALRVALRRLGRPARLLVAEDNPTNQFVLEQLLRSFDLTVDVVDDGEAAVAAALARPYDAICMDMRMPKMDGLEATRAIRRLGGHAATMPIIALTANAFPSDVKACLDAGMTCFVSKPVAGDRLFKALGSALSGKNDNEIETLPASAVKDVAAAIDADVLAVLIAALDRDTVLRMVEIFCAETEERLARFAAGTMDAMDLRDEMHALKGTAATVGATRLVQLAVAEEARLNAAPDTKVIEIADLVTAFDAYKSGLGRISLLPTYNTPDEMRFTLPAVSVH